MIVPPALLSRGQSEPLAESNAFLCLLLETANMRVVENVFTNFVNKVADTDIDFPVVHAVDAA